MSVFRSKELEISWNEARTVLLGENANAEAASLDITTLEAELDRFEISVCFEAYTNPERTERLGIEYTNKSLRITYWHVTDESRYLAETPKATRVRMHKFLPQFLTEMAAGRSGSILKDPEL